MLTRRNTEEQHRRSVEKLMRAITVESAINTSNALCYSNQLEPSCVYLLISVVRIRTSYDIWHVGQNLITRQKFYLACAVLSERGIVGLLGPSILSDLIYQQVGDKSYRRYT